MACAGSLINAARGLRLARCANVSPSDTPARALSAKLRASSPFFLIAGPCVIESRDHALRTADALRRITDRLGIAGVYKSSFDKANRTSDQSFRGPGLERGLEILADVKRETGMPVTTDVHETTQAAAAGEVVDILQIPAMLCRQTDLIQAAARTGRLVNIKKGQFADSGTMRQAMAKAQHAGSVDVLLTERGTTFGYGDLVVDARNLALMRDPQALVVLDVTHSVQQPGARGFMSGGKREFIPTIARVGAAVGVDGFFLETHEDPEKAKSDPANAWPLHLMEPLLAELIAIARASQGRSNQYL
eukprot:tig00000076_g2355.t1